jgi:hypothetical protein
MQTCQNIPDGRTVARRRVAQELGCEVGRQVGYTVRFEDRTNTSTRIKFLTDGCLMRECLDDAQLAQVSPSNLSLRSQPTNHPGVRVDVHLASRC